jgi:N6-adenosine-specific RNA methylase IME4
MTYSLIYADPPWQYGNNASNGAAKDHDTMSMADLKRLPVWALAEENAVLAMWYTGTHNREAIEAGSLGLYRSDDEGIHLGKTECPGRAAHQQGAGRW